MKEHEQDCRSKTATPGVERIGQGIDVQIGCIIVNLNGVNK